MTRGAARQRPRKEHDGLSTVLGVNRLMRERSGGVEARQHVPQIIVRARLVEGKVVLLEGRDDTIAREHRRALDDGRGADAIDARLRSEADGKFAYKVAERRLADVISLRAALGNNRVRRTGENDAGFEALGVEDRLEFVGEQVV